MFTGLIEEIGTVRRIERGAKGARLTIAADTVLENTKIGDSIATNGVCLTVVSLTDDSFSADVMAESLRRSALGSLPERLAGQSGARDACRRTVRRSYRIRPHRRHRLGSLAAARGQRRVGNDQNAGSPAPVHRRKGSIAIDGVSLTVAAVTDTDFSVSIIPHTGAQTILLGKKPGEPVNLECDVIGKYVEKMLTPHKSSGITMDFLAQHGF